MQMFTGRRRIFSERQQILLHERLSKVIWNSLQILQTICSGRSCFGSGQHLSSKMFLLRSLQVSDTIIILLFIFFFIKALVIATEFHFRRVKK